MALGTLAVAFLAVPGALAAIGPVATLNVANNVIEPDGFNRSAVLVNGQFPGPLITANKGDRFELTVNDQLTDPTMERSTSIHWHGIFQHTTNWADGVASVTQCPISPNNSFVYNFTVPDQAGTFWYHSHFSTQYCDGLRGPLVVYDPNDPYLDLYDVDDDTTVIVLSDWYHTVAPQLPLPPANETSTLVNGLGRYAGGVLSPLANITVQPGKRHRFRLVSTSCDPNFNVTIEGHNMTVIEADGILHEPVVVDQINIFTGQRYSFILEANQTVDNYWIRVNPSNGFQGYAAGINSAVLRYEGAPDTDPTSDFDGTYSNPLLETNLIPLDNPAAPGDACQGCVDEAINLPINVVNGAFLVNNFTYVQNLTTPVLLQILSGAQTAQSLLPPGSVYSLPANKTIELSFPMVNPGGAPHPVHLHGHAFSVVRSAGTTNYNYVNPPQRDVVSIGTTTSDNVTIRFVTDNPGPWFIHCHIDFHLAEGFAVVMAEDIPDISSVDAPPPDWDQLCPIYAALPPDEQLIGPA